MSFERMNTRGWARVVAAQASAVAPALVVAAAPAAAPAVAPAAVAMMPVANHNTQQMGQFVFGTGAGGESLYEALVALNLLGVDDDVHTVLDAALNLLGDGVEPRAMKMDEEDDAAFVRAAREVVPGAAWNTAEDMVFKTSQQGMEWTPEEAEFVMQAVGAMQ